MKKFAMAALLASSVSLGACTTMDSRTAGNAAEGAAYGAARAEFTRSVRPAVAAGAHDAGADA